MKKLRGFTLAEVLITLGVIGVVAALTLPTLIKNYQKHVLVNQLKKAVSVFEQGMQKMIIDESVDNLKQLPMFDMDNGCYQNGYGSLIGETLLKKYFKILKFSYDEFEAKYLDENLGEDSSSDPAPVYMSDGTIYYIDGCYSSNWIAGSVIIDVNGTKKPNQWGRDVFEFYITPLGNLVPIRGTYEQSKSSRYWKNGNYLCGTEGSSDISNVGGYGCAARIIENGWKMDY